MRLRPLPAWASQSNRCSFVLLSALRILVAGALVAGLNAQQPATVSGGGSAEVVKLQDFVVTGSNIARADLEKVAPLTVLDPVALEARGAVLPVDLLTSLPSVTNLPENETRLGSSGARGDNANINLRNLGATGTLILVNGRRMAINPMTAGLSQAVNVNQLPTQGIARVEILRDGASSIYGSDAVGGVINYVLRRDFNGAETSFRFGVPEHGGGQSSLGTLTFGRTFAGGRGRLFGTLEGLYRDAQMLTARDFSRSANSAARAPAPFNTLGGPFDLRSARGYFPTFRVGTATASTYLRLVGGVPTLTAGAPTRDGNPEFYLDLNQFGMASPRVRRGNTFLSAELDLRRDLTAFADFGYYKSQSTMRRQPLALNAPTSDQLAVMSADNPYNPYGSQFYHPAGAPTADGRPRLTGQPRTISLVSVTLPDLAAETVQTRADVARFSAGLRGKLGETWKWEASGFYNQVKGIDEAFPDVRESLLARALNRTDATAYNPFGYTFRVDGAGVVVDRPYRNPQAVVDSFSAVYSRDAWSRIISGDFRASGRLFTLWAGDLMAATGAEYRSEDLKDLRPPFSGENPAGSGLSPQDNDFLLHPPRPDVRGDRGIASLYAEAVIPLVSPRQAWPLMERLELTASARHERYSDFGGTTRPKVGANWRLASWLMARGSYNEGFMAPSLAALFTSPRWSISAGAGDIDTYRNPVTAEGPYVQRTYFGGNPNLRAAESKGETSGVVIDVPGVRGLSLTADHWRIRRTNLLGQRSVAQIRASDDALLAAYTKSQLAAGVAVNAINLGSGTASYRGDPDIQRYPVMPEDTAAFAAFNAANPGRAQAVAGRIFSVNQPFVNLSSSVHEGWDLSARYELPRLPFGQMVVSSDWAYLARAENTLSPANVAPTVNNELYANGAARWRGTTTVGWRQGAWSGSLGAYYVGRTHDAGATTTEAVYVGLGRPDYIAPFFTAGRTVYRKVVQSTLSLNATIGYRFPSDAAAWLRGVRVKAGVQNLTDAEPPLATDAFGYNPGVSQNLLAGRTWTLEVIRSF